MHLLVIILNKEEFLEDILSKLIDNGVRGATVLDSTGLGRVMNDKIPIFGGLNFLRESTRPRNKTILTVIHNKEILKKVMDEISEMLGCLQEPGTGIMFTIPAENVVGLAPPLNECKPVSSK